MRHLPALAAFALAGLLSVPAAGRPTVVRARLDGAIGPSTAEFVGRVLDEAEAVGATCVVLEMDTPGGLDAAMRRMVKRILGAGVPVVGYVSPPGSRAASAGAFLIQSAHIAAMAPGTNIGAAHPVQMGGAIPDTTLAAKAVNDAAAYIRSLAERRGRNADWAERAVRESISITAREAAEEHVVDLVAPTFAALLDSLDGREVETVSDVHRLLTAEAEVVDVAMGIRESLLSRISDPNVAYILMILGIYGLMFEFYSPGAIVPGVVGSICLVLAFYAFQALPVNYAGLLLVLLSVVLFILEIKVTSYGVLSIGGVVALVLGSTMLYRSPGNILRVSWGAIVPAAAASVLFFAFAVSMGVRAQGLRPRGGADELVGQTGVARTDLGADGTVFVCGEYWQATSSVPVRAGQEVRVAAVEGSHLRVDPQGT